MHNLNNKVIFLTGASLGIGRETAFLCAKEKCRLALTYYQDFVEAQKVEQKCLKLGASKVILLPLNLADDASIKNCVQAVIEEYQSIDILINNAATFGWKPFREYSFSEIEQQIRVNLEGTLKLTHVCLPYIKSTIINIASKLGKAGDMEVAPYSASKFGIRGFTQSLALEEPKLNIYAVNPRGTATRMNDFHGDTPLRIAEIILSLLKGKYIVDSGGDVDVWDYIS